MTVIKKYKKRNKACSNGFSLIELVVIIMVLGILAAVASTRMKDVTGGVSVSVAINQITSDLDLIKELSLASHENMSIVFNDITNSYTIKQGGNIMVDYPGSENGIVDISDGNLSNVSITSSNLTLNIDKWGNYLNGGIITLNGTHNISVSSLTGNWEIIEL
tara:strand:+ start:43 stop:528 length:486 start_codon:yes stop_codon:yes gene_type:complete